MKKIKNYERFDTLATGFVRPKVTALFFDKLWLPESLVDSCYAFHIPYEVLVSEDRELLLEKKGFTRAGRYYQRSILPNRGGPFGDVYRMASSRNFAFPPSYFFDEYPLESEFKYSSNRNHAIMLSAESFSRKYGIHISPVYHNLTEFEQDMQKLTTDDVCEKRRKRSAKIQNAGALSICIQDFPNIVEDELSWEHVLEIRKDKERIKQFKQFISWTDIALSNKKPEQIREVLETELDSYKEALKVHGIITVAGCFSTVVSTASSIAEMVTASDHLLLPLLSIAATSINFTATTYFSNPKNKNKPIAYLYGIQNL